MLSSSSASSSRTDYTASAPAVSLPKGGGAIQGIGEKFSVNPVTGTGALSVPIAVSPGRGFAPELAVSYDSGAGNGPFGMGWAMGVPSIRRKTQKGLPRYLDIEDSDEFLLSGAEDLVPLLEEEPENIDAVRDSIGRSQKNSLRRWSQELHLFLSSVHRILKNDQLYPNRIHIKQTLTQDGMTKHVGMCQWFENKIEEQQDFFPN